MPIDLEFPRNNQVIGRHNHADDQHYHFVWDPGRLADAAENEDVKAAYAARSEEFVPMVYMVLWSQLTGIPVLLMDLV